MNPNGDVRSATDEEVDETLRLKIAWSAETNSRINTAARRAREPPSTVHKPTASPPRADQIR
jgi:hypothetical protein